MATGEYFCELPRRFSRENQDFKVRICPGDFQA
jgi:hypothetical protein